MRIGERCMSSSQQRSGTSLPARASRTTSRRSIPRPAASGAAWLVSSSTTDAVRRRGAQHPEMHAAARRPARRHWQLAARRAGMRMIAVMVAPIRSRNRSGATSTPLEGQAVLRFRLRARRARQERARPRRAASPRSAAPRNRVRRSASAVVACATPWSLHFSLRCASTTCARFACTTSRASSGARAVRQMPGARRDARPHATADTGRRAASPRRGSTRARAGPRRRTACARSSLTWPTSVHTTALAPVRVDVSRTPIGLAASCGVAYVVTAIARQRRCVPPAARAVQSAPRAARATRPPCPRSRRATIPTSARRRPRPSRDRCARASRCTPRSTPGATPIAAAASPAARAEAGVDEHAALAALDEHRVAAAAAAEHPELHRTPPSTAARTTPASCARALSLERRRGGAPSSARPPRETYRRGTSSKRARLAPRERRHRLGRHRAAVHVRARAEHACPS